MRLLPGARLAYGVPLLLAPSVAVRLAGSPADGASAAVARILGARHVAQALTLERAGSRSRVLLGAGVDLLHTLSMIGVAALSKDHRRAASLDAALALGLAACGLWGIRHG